MPIAFINPGTSYVPDKTITFEVVRANLVQFLADSKIDGAIIGAPSYVTPGADTWAAYVSKVDGSPSFGFRVTLGEVETHVDLPLVSLDVLRGLIVDAPRLYVEGESYWWEYARNPMRAALGLKELRSLEVRVTGIIQKTEPEYIVRTTYSLSDLASRPQ